MLNLAFLKVSRQGHPCILDRSQIRGGIYVIFFLFLHESVYLYGEIRKIAGFSERGSALSEAMDRFQVLFTYENECTDLICNI